MFFSLQVKSLGFGIKVDLYGVLDKIIEKEPQHMEAFTMDSQHFAWKLEIRDRFDTISITRLYILRETQLY